MNNIEITIRNKTTGEVKIVDTNCAFIVANRPGLVPYGRIFIDGTQGDAAKLLDNVDKLSEEFLDSNPQVKDIMDNVIGFNRIDYHRLHPKTVEFPSDIIDPELLLFKTLGMRIDTDDPETQDILNKLWRDDKK